MKSVTSILHNIGVLFAANVFFIFLMWIFLFISDMPFAYTGSTDAFFIKCLFSLPVIIWLIGIVVFFVIKNEIGIFERIFTFSIAIVIFFTFYL